jgi:hypothetical protein
VPPGGQSSGCGTEITTASLFREAQGSGWTQICTYSLFFSTKRSGCAGGVVKSDIRLLAGETQKRLSGFMVVADDYYDAVS